MNTLARQTEHDIYSWDYEAEYPQWRRRNN